MTPAFSGSAWLAQRGLTDRAVEFGGREFMMRSAVTAEQAEALAVALNAGATRDLFSVLLVDPTELDDLVSIAQFPVQSAELVGEFFTDFLTALVGVSPGESAAS